jgi:hypothetical protein
MVVVVVVLEVVLVVEIVVVVVAVGLSLQAVDNYSAFLKPLFCIHRNY